MLRAVEKGTSNAFEHSESTLKPLLTHYIQSVDKMNWETVKGFFHPDAVVVLKGREATYGLETIIANKIKFAEMSGKSVTTLSNLKYEGSGNYLIVSGSLMAKTEKIGSLKGKFVQIWKKEDGRYLIFHDQFEIVL
ncbi:hypothetical protein CAEBREN_12616 [Caenorhabditis brenneri]|uniref:DUF4440 domain-containing protein n=1 Tax=Caenorhabditis brenneri TaxID=135651 RepID=G0NN74_CAEBE|nr:hypothetical protein CAEBREN_12616 [Caenorhabditis brenneri]